MANFGKDRDSVPRRKARTCSGHRPVEDQDSRKKGILSVISGHTLRLKVRRASHAASLGWETTKQRSEFGRENECLEGGSHCPLVSARTRGPAQAHHNMYMANAEQQVTQIPSQEYRLEEYVQVNGIVFGERQTM